MVEEYIATCSPAFKQNARALVLQRARRSITSSSVHVANSEGQVHKRHVDRVEVGEACDTWSALDA